EVGNFHDLEPVLMGLEVVIRHLAAEFGLDRGHRLASHLPLIERLHSQLTGCTAALLGTGWHLLLATLLLITAHESLSCDASTPKQRSSETISIAAMAASIPLLPALVPARSMACSMELTVSTPLATGVSNSSCRRDSAELHSPATCSKCGVPPRITDRKSGV